MSASKSLTAHLGKHNVRFEVVPHRKVYTAYDLAQTLGEKLEAIAKTLLVKVDLPELKKTGAHYVVVVPASYNIDLGKVKKALKAKKIELASEKAMVKLGIQPGALTPFGSMRGFGVVLDKALLKAKDVLVGAESFTESLRMKAKDLVAVEAPVIGVFGKKNKLKLQKSGKAGKRKSGKGPKKSAKKKTAKKKPARRR